MLQLSLEKREIGRTDVVSRSRETNAPALEARVVSQTQKGAPFMRHAVEDLNAFRSASSKTCSSIKIPPRNTFLLTAENEQSHEEQRLKA